ncbi:MAG: hypothetical protein HY923_02460 [Elusimicrobia bacterium]|nr:hypothetical protein [Elusimicrobiota bacterium]
MIPVALRLHNPMSAVVWLALFVPGHFLGGRLGLLLPAGALLLSGAASLTLSSPWETRRPGRQAAGLFFLLALLDAVSYAYSTAFNGIRTGAGDVWALSRYPVAGAFTVYLIQHYDESVRKSLETGLTAAIYLSLFLLSIGARSWYLFEPAGLLGCLSVLAAIHFLFFSLAPLRRVHAAASALVVLFNAPPVLTSSREAFAYFGRSPVFGWGPALYEPMSTLGNQYLRWLLRNGVLGAGLILIGLCLVAFRLLRASWDDPHHLLGAALFLGVVAGMLMLGAFLEDFRIFVLTAMLIAGMHAGVRS